MLARLEVTLRCFIGAQIDRSLRELQRKLLTENAMKEWRGAEVFIPPAQQRVLARKESEKRFRRHHFKRMLGLVLAQRQRGF
jgi:ribosomal protein S21